MSQPEFGLLIFHPPLRFPFSGAENLRITQLRLVTASWHAEHGRKTSLDLILAVPGINQIDNLSPILQFHPIQITGLHSSLPFVCFPLWPKNQPTGRAISRPCFGR